jgi:hypothetical protein
MLLVGLVLVLALVADAIGSGVAYLRSGYDGKFWALPLEEKLAHIDANRRDWWWMSMGGLKALFLLTGGIAGLTFLLAEAGETPLASVSFGFYIIGMIAWVLAMIFQTTALPRAASMRIETDTAPDWLHPIWDAGAMAEMTWVIGANTAYALFGLAIIESGLVPSWVGWTALILGAAIALSAAVTRWVFPQMAEFVPFIIGLALIFGAI